MARCSPTCASRSYAPTLTAAHPNCIPVAQRDLDKRRSLPVSPSLLLWMDHGPLLPCLHTQTLWLRGTLTRGAASPSAPLHCSGWIMAHCSPACTHKPCGSGGPGEGARPPCQPAHGPLKVWAVQEPEWLLLHRRPPAAGVLLPGGAGGTGHVRAMPAWAGSQVWQAWAVGILLAHTHTHTHSYTCFQVFPACQPVLEQARANFAMWQQDGKASGPP